MRGFGGLLTSLLVLAAGCAAPSRVDAEAGRRPQANVSCCGQAGGASYRTAPTEPGPLTDKLKGKLVGVAQNALSSVAQIRTVLERPAGSDSSNEGTRPTSTRLGGTGIVIAPDGLILTNEHVVRNAATISVTVADGSTHRTVRVVVAPRLDLAILRIDETELEPLALATESPERGTVVVAVAAPGKRRPVAYRFGFVTNPVVSIQDDLDATRTRHYEELIESTTRLEAGFSGGPLINVRGRVVGLNVAACSRAADAHHRGYAIPFNRHTQDVIARLVREATD